MHFPGDLVNYVWWMTTREEKTFLARHIYTQMYYRRLEITGSNSRLLHDQRCSLDLNDPTTSSEARKATSHRQNLPCTATVQVRLASTQITKIKQASAGHANCPPLLQKLDSKARYSSCMDWNDVK